MATPRLGLVVEDKPTELSCILLHRHTYTLSPPSITHMASWFSQDITDSSSCSYSLLEGGDEAHEQCLTAWLHEHWPVVHLRSLHLLTLYSIS